MRKLALLQGPLLLTRINFNFGIIRDCTPSKACGEITYPFLPRANNLIVYVYIYIIMILYDTTPHVYLDKNTHIIAVTS